ncbi:RICIN domain-containing protein [Kineosporia succinea]|uniref:Ricin B lectin domain-containing protein n=1 Tax=Kineosporia succinea TaxID=84632 RepID=A0ABT9P508_9ACTN|nr:RICIN domain-containing protein [Kineosporia succinea]MDP9827763.1 hypothetical protein [Kineosporia succinea]
MSGEDRTERERGFLDSGKGPATGRRPGVGVPTRGLRGVAVISGSLAVVAGVVLGGMVAIDAVGGGPGGGGAQDASLAASDLQSTVAPPTAGATAGPESARETEPVKPTETKDPVRTKTVTRTVGVTASPKGGKPAVSASAGPRRKAPGPVVRAAGLIKNLKTGLCVDLPGTGAAGENVLVTQYTCTYGSGDNQEYELLLQPDGTFAIRNVKSHWCLDVNGSGAAESGIVVNTHTCLLGDGDNQMFTKQKQGGGFYLKNVKSGLCLDVSDEGDGNLAADQQLRLLTCSPDDDHVWTFSS